MNQALKDLLQNNSSIWRGRESVQVNVRSLSTGFKALDDILPANGWPLNALVEILLPHWGIGELQLLLPALVSATQNKPCQARQTEKQWIAMLAPPFIPYAPALSHAGVNLEHFIVIPKEAINNEALWAMEKILHSQSCCIAMCWPHYINDKAVRRLQVMAEERDSLGFIFRTQRVYSSAAALRLSLAIIGRHLQVTVLKARGISSRKRVLIELPII